MIAVDVPERLSPNVAGIILFLCVLLVILLIRRIIYRHQAECWFCSKAVTVTYFKRNSFTCPHCEQYNGFNEDGDYNRPIPAMHNAFLNQSRPHTEVPGGQAPGRGHFLCATCQSNQATKIKQLSSFVPISEVTYNAEYKNFCEQQDELYQLCPPCLLRVNQEIERQDLVLAPTLHYYQNKKKLEEQKAGNWLSRWVYNILLFVVQLATVAATVCLCAPDILDLLGTEKSHRPMWIKYYDKQSIAITGLSLLVLSVLLSGKERLRKMDGFFLMVLLLIVAFPQMDDLPVLRKSALIYGNKYLLAPLCLVTSVVWFIVPYARLLKPKKVKRAPTPQTDELEASSGDEGEDEEVTLVPGTPTLAAQDPGPSTSQDPGPSTSQYPRPSTSQDPGPSTSQGPVHNGIDSLTLGPPGNTPKKQNDVWTSRIGNNTPPLPGTEGFRPVVHPARFNYASGSIPGSAATSVVDGPASSRPSNRAVQYDYRARQAQAQTANKPDQDDGDDDTSGINESSDEGFSSISQRSEPGRRRRWDRRQRRWRPRRHPWRNSAASIVHSLFLPVVFGVSIGLNLSAALYLHYKDM